MLRICAFLIVPIAAIFATWGFFSQLFPAVKNPNGIAIAVGGIVVAGTDLYLRIRRNPNPLAAVFVSQYPVPTISGIPFWVVGIVMMVGGTSVFFSRQ